MQKRHAVTNVCVTGALLLGYAVSLSAEQLPIKVYTDADGLSHNRVRRIMRDSRGFLWFCAGDRVSRYDGNRFFTYDLGVGPSDIIEGAPGIYWLASYGNGVYRFTASAPPNSPSRMTKFSMGTAPASNFINVLFRDHLGRIWAGTDNGLYVSKVNEGESEFHRVDLGIQAPEGVLIEVGAFAEDREGSIWIGTAQGPVRRLPDGRMILYEPPLPDRMRFVRGLLADVDGRVWIGHSSGLIVLLPEPASNVTSGGSFSKRILPKVAHRTSAEGNLQLPTGPERWNWLEVEGLGLRAVRAIKQFSDGTIMVGTYGAGLYIFSEGRLRGYTTAHGLSENTVYTFAEDLEGNRWMGTAAGGVMKLLRSGFTGYSEPDGVAREGVVSIFETTSGQVCVVTLKGRIDLFDGHRFTGIRLDLPPAVSVSSGVGRENYPAIQDHTEEWWVASGGGIHRFQRVNQFADLARIRPKRIYAPRGLTETDILFEDSRGDIWFGMRSGHQLDGGIFRWERSADAVRLYSQSDGLPPFAWPQSFAEDAAGNVWIGLYEGGVLRYASGRFQRLTAAHGVPAGMIRSLYCDSRGRLWLGTNVAGAVRIEDPASDHPRVVTYSIAQGLATNNVLGITEDKWGRIYLGTSRGVDRLDPANGVIRHFTSADGLKSGEVTTAYRDRSGGLWFGTSHGPIAAASRSGGQIRPARYLDFGNTRWRVSHASLRIGRCEDRRDSLESRTDSSSRGLLRDEFQSGRHSAVPIQTCAWSEPGVEHGIRTAWSRFCQPRSGPLPFRGACAECRRNGKRKACHRRILHFAANLEARMVYRFYGVSGGINRIRSSPPPVGKAARTGTG